MNFPAAWIKTFAAGLIYVVAIQPTLSVHAYSQDNGARADEVVLAEGTSLNLVTVQEISSKVAKLGDPVSFKVDEDVAVNGHVVISKGTPARGSVINAEKSGRMGKSGKLGVQVESTTTVDGQPLRLRAAHGKEGDDKTNSVVALSMLSGFFLLKKGEDAKIKEGTRVKVYVGEEKRFRVSGASLVAQDAAAQPATPGAASPGGAGDSHKDEMVTVYVYRPGKLVGKALEPSVFCDGVELARMDNGRFLTLKLKPGKHMVHLTDKKKGFQTDMGGGQVYYFRVGIEMGMWKGQGKITLDDAERGAEEIKKLKPLDGSKIKDHTMVVADETKPNPDR